MAVPDNLKPDHVRTGPERIALRNQLINDWGLTNGQASAVANANSNADMVNKMAITCKGFPKGGNG